MGGPGAARKKRYTSSREEEGAQMCRSRRAKEGRTHIVGECDVHKEERDLLEMRKIDECDTGDF